MSDSRTPPWKRQQPATEAKEKLPPASIAWARARAQAAGRRYPNLVDNMAALRRQREAGAKGARRDLDHLLGE